MENSDQAPPVNLTDAFRVHQMGMCLVPRRLSRAVFKHDAAQVVVSMTATGDVDSPGHGILQGFTITSEAVGTWLITLEHLAHMAVTLPALVATLPEEARWLYDKHLAVAQSRVDRIEPWAHDMEEEAGALTPDQFHSPQAPATPQSDQ